MTATALETLPAGWRWIRLKHLCLRSALYGANEAAESYVDNGVRFLRTTDISDSGELSRDGAVFLPPETVRDYLLTDGDLLLSRSGTIGRSFVYSRATHGPCAYAGYLVRFVPSERLNPGFAYYVTKSDYFLNWLDTQVVSSTIGNVNGKKYGNLPVPTPPITEQRAIADFLDRETEVVDQLIRRKQEIIALLELKRSSLIADEFLARKNESQRDTPLGSLPASWAVKRLKFITDQITVGIVITPSKYYVDEGVPCIRSFNVKPMTITDCDLVYISDESNELHRKSKIYSGDVVAVRTGQPGTAAVVPEKLDGANCIDLIIIRRPQIRSELLAYFLNSAMAKLQFEAGSNGAIQQHFNIEQAKNLIVPVPPYDQQDAILGRLAVTNRTLDALITKVEQGIVAAREYRTTVISAAVTGQIDVRNYRPQEAAVLCP